MATYKGLFEIEGALGDAFFYKLNGKKVVRQRSGFSKKDYENNPNYAGIRRNSGEFGRCSQAGKALRSALHPFLKDRSDKYAYQRLTKIMTQIKDLDNAPHGERTVFGGWNNQRSRKLLNSMVWQLKQERPTEFQWHRTETGLKFKCFGYAETEDVSVLIYEILLKPDLTFEKHLHTDQIFEEEAQIAFTSALSGEGIHFFAVCVGDFVEVVG